MEDGSVMIIRNLPLGFFLLVGLNCFDLAQIGLTACIVRQSYVPGTSKFIHIIVSICFRNE